MADLKVDGSLQFVTEDINKFLKKSPNEGKTIKTNINKKRRNLKHAENTLFSNISTIKTELSSLEINNRCTKKVLNNMNQEIKCKKQEYNKLLASLSEILKSLEEQYKSLKDNEEKLKHLIIVSKKYMEQNVAAHKERIKNLKEIYMAYKQWSEEMDTQVKVQNTSLIKELEDSIEKLIEKLTSNAKRKVVESMCESLFEAIQENL